MQRIPIWEGSSIYYPGDTPYGFYDNSATFQNDIVKAADWAAKRLGYPISDVELQDKHFFSAYEEAITEYGYWVNTFAAEDNLMTLMGLEIDSIDPTQQFMGSSTQAIFKIAREYSTAAGTGGNLRHYSGSLELQPGQQVYDLRSDMTLSLETGSADFSQGKYVIRRIFHESVPAGIRSFDPFASTGTGFQNLMNQFDWGGMTPSVSFTLMPVYTDVLRMQAIEFNDRIRKSGYSFELTADRLRIFPIPNSTVKLWFHYTLDDDALDMISDNEDLISDHSTVPYKTVNYNKLNEISKQWIRKYYLAICKETLGRIRGKYSSVPIPDQEIQLNWSELLSEAAETRQNLVEELRETLNKMSKIGQFERKADEAEHLSRYLKFVPMSIYTT